MASTVLVLRHPASPETTLRCEAVGGYLARLRTISGADSGTIVADGCERPVELLSRLAEAGQLTSAGHTLLYVPSRAARDRVAGDEDGAWPKAVIKRHRKQTRPSQGAIYRFPLEPGSSAGTEEVQQGTIAAFVTDWTGMPAACGIAIHPAHRLSPGLPDDSDSSFTGRYCRHPLSGDLLPIWVADWVKPDLGTGAVLLNPGHNLADLDFARHVGLPIRLALQPPSEEWPQPPVIRSGVAVRSGIADGASPDEAGDRYLQAVADRGLAELHRDNGMGVFPVAQLTADGPIEAPWHRERRTIATAGSTGALVRIEPLPVLLGLDPAIREADLTVVAPSAQVEGELLALRLLLAEDSEPAVKSAPDLEVVANATAPASWADEAPSNEALHLAALVSVASTETLALRAEQIERSQRFIETHRAVLSRERVAAGERSADIAKAGSQVKRLLGARDLKRGFTELYRLQKSLAKEDQINEPDLRAYCALSHVIADLDAPYDDEVRRQEWASL